MSHSPDALRAILLTFVPADGSAIGNGALRKAASEHLGAELGEETYNAARDALVDAGLLLKGAGRGGSVRLSAQSQDAPDTFELQSPEPKAPKAKSLSPKKAAPTSSTRPSAKSDETQVLSYRHADRRRNNPEVGMVDPDTDPATPKTEWAYDPHLDPALQFDIGRAQTEKLIDDALESGDQDTMRAALQQLRRQAQPYLNWTGKAERTSFEVDTVSLHVHERIDPASILHAVRKQMRNEKTPQPKMQLGLFSAPFENLPLREAIDFYKHDRGWSNRLIAGDSLLVMNSLLQKESMAGQVQMIYIDPPYGIKYGSNFQPFVGKRDVKDGADTDLTQEPETLKAFRDTWELGEHSYLSYLRDRLNCSKELLTESGSLFLQISEDNLHYARNVCDEVLGRENFAGLITFKKTTGAGSPSGGTDVLASVSDYIIWYAKNRGAVKYRPLFREKQIGGAGASAYLQARDRDGRTRRLQDYDTPGPETRVFTSDNLTSQSSTGPQIFRVNFTGLVFFPQKGGWKTTTVGLGRLVKTSRTLAAGNTLRYVRFFDDFVLYPFSTLWDDTTTAGFADAKTYVVQTNAKVIERCMLMTTDPGDLVFDPTCGSGTTAAVAERWGRRWITCDTSRVAITLAKQRMMTASYDYFDLKYPLEGLKGGFVYKTVPHVMLKSIANNPEIDEIYTRLHPLIETLLGELNTCLRAKPPLPFAVTEGGRKGGKVDFGAAANKTVTLPSGETAAAGSLLEWEVPFDFPADWPADARSAFDKFHAARQAMQKAMDASIAAHADQEVLYDQPKVDKTKLRITGPFTVEAVPFPSVLTLAEALPASMDAEPTSQRRPADADIARSGITSRQHQWRDELLRTGIRGKGGQQLKFATLETLPDTRYVHASGTLADSGERVVVSFGPEHAALENMQVEMAMREAGELFPRPKMIVFAAFVFDPEAAKDIDETKGITALKAHMNTDLLTDDLKKGRSTNQSFWLMGQPDIELRKLEDGMYEVEVNGFDYFDTAKEELVSGGKGKIAMWLLDTDYDERSLFPRQVFLPMAGAKDGWQKLRKDIRAELDESRLAEFHGTVSLPFAAGDHKKIAIKLVDDRGIESLKVMKLS